MSLAIVNTRANLGIDAPPVTVEVHLANGLPALSIVGLPETAVKESKDRVRAAIINSGFEFPSRRITINLAPADLPKDGGRYDLPIALGILLASEQLHCENIHQYEFIGELALGGDLRKTNGVLPAILAAFTSKHKMVIPHENSEEASLIPEANTFTATSLIELTYALSGREEFQQPLPVELHDKLKIADMNDVIGQPQAKRALEIAAAGKHSLLMFGPPGSGKSMLASRLPGIMPDLTHDEAIEVAAIQSISSQGFKLEQWKVRPFRTPHHTSSGVAIVGGGGSPKPGEISLAHHGVLFLDELPEFKRQTLEVLREPLESGKITISRAAGQAEFPAKFQLITAMNPCPCGYLGDSSSRCHCSPLQIDRYRSRISGPLLDRIDLQIAVPRQASELFKTNKNEESSKEIKKRVTKVHTTQLQRCKEFNSQLSSSNLKKFCKLDAESEKLLQTASNKLALSARSYHRIIKVARTIADLAEEKNIQINHLAEALSYREK